MFCLPKTAWPPTLKINWKWMLGIAALLVILFFLPSLYQSVFGYAGFGSGMMGRFGWHRPMMGGFGWPYSMMSPFGGLFMGFGMLLGWLVPLALLFFLVYGAVTLINRTHVHSVDNPSAPATRPSPEAHCGNCGEAVETGWKACPYCGEKL